MEMVVANFYWRPGRPVPQGLKFLVRLGAKWGITMASFWLCRVFFKLLLQWIQCGEKYLKSDQRRILDGVLDPVSAECCGEGLRNRKALNINVRKQVEGRCSAEVEIDSPQTGP